MELSRQPVRRSPGSGLYSGATTGTAALTYCALGRYLAKALADIDAAIRLDPNVAAAYLNRGVIYKSLGRYVEALTDYDTAIRIDPNYVEAYFNRGIAYGDLGQHVDALADYDAAIRLDPSDADWLTPTAAPPTMPWAGTPRRSPTSMRRYESIPSHAQRLLQPRRQLPCPWPPC